MSASGSHDPLIPISQAATASAAPVVPPAHHGLGTLGPGSIVSRYRIESVLGEGGMGVVYLARQEKPDRQVALKVVRPGYATERMLRRFELEAEVLGRLLHPGIAQIYEAGVWTGEEGFTTETQRHREEGDRAGEQAAEEQTADLGAGEPRQGGERGSKNPPTSVGGSTKATRIPFFAMELVKGVPLTKYAEEKKLGTRERLELVAKICDAVQHAHQKGVIHRDLKPGNILVVDEVAEWPSGEVAKWEGRNSGPPRSGRHSATLPLRHSATSPVGQPKILDFGVARATDSDLQQTTVQTDVGAIIGTIPYMSPEQVGGDPAELDTRSDVYALGVIAYELLVGRLPYSLERKMIHEAARIIREEEPTRLSSIDRALRGDVETIVGHALEKDKARRYGAASALAADIRRYLSDEPIAARPASTWYQIAKFSRRNTALVGGIAATFLVLIAGIAATAVALQRESEQRALAQANETRANEEKSRAEAEAERAKKAEAEEKKRADELKQVSDFQESMLAQIDPTQAGYRLQADLNAKFAAALEKANVPEAERGAMADTFRSGLHRVNLTDAARELIDRTILKPAVDAIDRQFKDQPLVDAQLRQVLATRYHDLGLYDAAYPLQESALKTRQRVLGEEHPETLTSINNMGGLLQAQGKLAEAEPYYREALEKFRRVLGEEHPSTIGSINNMGVLLLYQGKLAEAEPYHRESLEKRRRVLGEEHPDTISAIHNMGFLLEAQGKLAEAEPYCREALEKYRRVRGEEHPDTIRSIGKMGSLLRARGRLAEAEPYFREALEKRRRVLGEEHPATLVSIGSMSALLYSQGKLADAEPFVREAMDKSRRVHGEEHPDTLSAINNMGNLLQAEGKLDQAEPYLREVLEKFRRVLGEEHPLTITSISSMGMLLRAQGKLAEGEPYLREALEKSRRVLGEEHPKTLAAVSYLGLLLAAQGKLTEAEPFHREALEKKRRVLGEEHPDTLVSLYHLTNLFIKLERFAEASPMAEECTKGHINRFGPGHNNTRRVIEQAVTLYESWDKADPGKGHDTKAAEWKARLDALPPPKPPAAAPAPAPATSPPPAEPAAGTEPATSSEPK